jgi:hypothetical protein
MLTARTLTVISVAAIAGASAYLVARPSDRLTENRVAGAFREVGLPLVSLRDGRGLTVLMRPHAARDPLLLSVSVFPRSADARMRQGTNAAADRVIALGRVPGAMTRSVVVENTVIVFNSRAPGAARVLAALARLRE